MVSFVYLRVLSGFWFSRIEPLENQENASFLQLTCVPKSHFWGYEMHCRETGKWSYNSDRQDLLSEHAEPDPPKEGKKGTFFVRSDAKTKQLVTPPAHLCKGGSGALAGGSSAS